MHGRRPMDRSNPSFTYDASTRGRCSVPPPPILVGRELTQIHEPMSAYGRARLPSQPCADRGSNEPK